MRSAEWNSSLYTHINQCRNKEVPIMEKKQAIEERFAILHNEVYCQMTNAEKNEFDPEVELPVLKEMFIDLKKKLQFIKSERHF